MPDQRAEDNHESGPWEPLLEWIDAVPKGRALDLGAGDGEVALWLAGRGFAVEAVEVDAGAARRLRRKAGKLPVHVHQADVTGFEPDDSSFSLVVAAAVLHFIRPTRLWSLADQWSQALQPGGVLMAEAFTTDDPGYQALRALGATEVEPNTFIAPEPVGLIHYFVPGELRRLFPELEVLHYEEYRRLDQGDPGGLRAGAVLVARMPEEA